MDRRDFLKTTAMAAMLCWLMVASSFIVNPNPPSPLIETTTLSGFPTLAPSAVQKPLPSVP